MLFDLPLEELQKYRPKREEPKDFERFWEETLHEAEKHPLDASFRPAGYPLPLIETLDVEFSGYGGERIKGWLLLPRERRGRIPCMVEFLGSGGGRGYPTDWLLWASAGYAHFVMDTRGQGSAWSPGETPDPEPSGSNPHHPGFMTRGVLDPRTYYYRRVYTDGVRAVECARSHPAIDPGRVLCTGVSQGGGIAIAVAGLCGNLAAVMPDVPFLCHFRVATEITDRDPYKEIGRYCTVHRDKIAQVFTTLAYFDGVNFAARSKAPALFSVGLMDEICPPRTVFAAFNHYAGKKEIRVWKYNSHEGGQTFQTLEKLRFAAGYSGINPPALP